MGANKDEQEKALNLKGHLLISMPGMEDVRFARTVILISAHNANGAMGFILNQPVSSPLFEDILKELEYWDELKAVGLDEHHVPVYRGGPVEQGRGFIIHSLDYSTQATVRVDDIAGVSATRHALKALCGSLRPQESILCLGYSGWAGGQLEFEIARNGWLTLPATEELLFKTPHFEQYDKALAEMGISEALLSSSAGHA